LIIPASQVCVGVKDTDVSLRVAFEWKCGTAATAKMMSTDIPILVDWLIMEKLWI
jgi:hypothetical protein